MRKLKIGIWEIIAFSLLVLCPAFMWSIYPSVFQLFKTKNYIVGINFFWQTTEFFIKNVKVEVGEETLLAAPDTLCQFLLKLSLSFPNIICTLWAHIFFSVPHFYLILTFFHCMHHLFGIGTQSLSPCLANLLIQQLVLCQCGPLLCLVGAAPEDLPALLGSATFTAASHCNHLSQKLVLHDITLGIFFLLLFFWLVGCGVFICLGFLLLFVLFFIKVKNIFQLGRKKRERCFREVKTYLTAKF